MKVRNSTTKALSEILANVAEIAPIEDVQRFQKMIENWSVLVDGSFAGKTRPLSFKDGTLVVEAMQIEETDTVNQVKATLARFGVTAVMLRLHQQSSPAQPSLETVSSSAAVRAAAIQDEPLRHAMAKLISAYEKSGNHL